MDNSNIKPILQIDNKEILLLKDKEIQVLITLYLIFTYNLKKVYNKYCTKIRKNL